MEAERDDAFGGCWGSEKHLGHDVKPVATMIVERKRIAFIVGEVALIFTGRKDVGTEIRLGLYLKYIWGCQYDLKIISYCQ